VLPADGRRLPQGPRPRTDGNCAPRRLLSVDALRGLAVAAILLVNDPGDWSQVPPWLEHASWNGCTFADYIFPCFLFIAAVSLTLARGSVAAEPQQRGATVRNILGRGLRIVLLGMLLEAVRWALIAPDHAYRPCGVLQRIGVCYALAGDAAGLGARRAPPVGAHRGTVARLLGIAGRWRRLAPGRERCGSRGQRSARPPRVLLRRGARRGTRS
jgi:uncharacterized membrane protein